MAASHAPFNVTASYPDMASARRGVEVLEEHGIEADDISLGGQPAREAATTGDTAQRDRSFLRQVRNTVLTGVLSGLVVGAVLGFIVGVATFGAPGSEGSNIGGLGALTFGLAAAGAGVGLTAAAMSRMKQSQAWEATLEEPTAQGEVVVGAHTENRAAFERAAKALEGTTPSQISRFDHQGNPLPA